VSLADHVRAALTPARPACKTCQVLGDLDAADRTDFAACRDVGVSGAVLARALTSRLAEMGDSRTLSEGSVRTHIRDGHGA
jgi:hypothetical protein